MMKIKPYSKNNETKAKIVIGSESDMPLPRPIVPHDEQHVLPPYTSKQNENPNSDRTHQSKHIQKLMCKPWLKP